MYGDDDLIFRVNIRNGLYKCYYKGTAREYLNICEVYKKGQRSKVAIFFGEVTTLAFEALISVISSAFYSSFESFCISIKGDGVYLPKSVLEVGIMVI